MGQFTSDDPEEGSNRYAYVSGNVKASVKVTRAMEYSRCLSKEAEEKLKEIGAIPSGMLTANLETGFVGISAEQMECQPTEQGQVFGPVAHADPAGIFAKDPKEDPMELVCHAPVLPHSLLEERSGQRCTENSIARVKVGCCRSVIATRTSITCSASTISSYYRVPGYFLGAQLPCEEDAGGCSCACSSWMSLRTSG